MGYWPRNKRNISQVLFNVLKAYTTKFFLLYIAVLYVQKSILSFNLVWRFSNIVNIRSKQCYFDSKRPRQTRGPRSSKINGDHYQTNISVISTRKVRIYGAYWPRCLGIGQVLFWRVYRSSRSRGPRTGKMKTAISRHQLRLVEKQKRDQTSLLKQNWSDTKFQYSIN